MASSTPKRGKRSTVKSGKGRAQARASNPAQQAALFKWYNTQVHPTNMAEQRFRVTGYIRGGQKKISLGPYLAGLQWQDLSAQAWLQGNATLRAVSNQREHLAITHGDVIRTEVFWDKAWRYLWDMRVWDPDRTLAAGDPQFVATLYDDLYQLSISMDDFHYKNLYCHEIFLRVADKYQIPTGQIAMGTYKIKSFNELGISPLDAIIAAYRIERDHSGRRFVIKWRKGKVNITPLQRNPILYVLHQQLVDATVHHVTPTDFATSLTGRSSATNKKNNKVQKHVFTAQANVPTYGYIHQQQDYSGNYNETHLESSVKHDLTKRQIIGHTVDFDHQGIALISKGDAVKLDIPEEGYTGKSSIVWVSDITHTLEPGTYTMAPTVSAAAPIGLPDVVIKSKNKSQRSTKRAKRKRLSKPAKKAYNGSSAGGSSPTPPSTKGTTDVPTALHQLLRGGSGP